MPDLLIRDLSTSTQATLKAQAVRNGRSLSAEIRAILDKAAAQAGAQSALSVADQFFPPDLRLSAEEAAVFEQGADHPVDVPSFG